MIHHISLGTDDLARSRRFYDALLPVVGLRFIAADAHGFGFGSGTLHFCIEKPVDGAPASVGNGTHVAFSAETRTMVEEFHRVALEHGATCDGPPGLRPKYDAHYYGAFVRDPDGHKLEACSYSAK